MSCLTRLTGLKLNVHAPLYQASVESCKVGCLAQHSQCFLLAVHTWCELACSCPWRNAPPLVEQQSMPELPSPPKCCCQAEPEEVDAFVGTIGRRLTGLRRLELFAALSLSEAAMQHISGSLPVECACCSCMVHISPACLDNCLFAVVLPSCLPGCLAGLTALTELSIWGAHDFGPRALESLRPLASLRRLSVSDTSLDAAAVSSVLDESDTTLPLLPSLTRLTLHSCRLLRWGVAGGWRRQTDASPVSVECTQRVTAMGTHVITSAALLTACAVRQM